MTLQIRLYNNNNKLHLLDKLHVSVLNLVHLQDSSSSGEVSHTNKLRAARNPLGVEHRVVQALLNMRDDLRLFQRRWHFDQNNTRSNTHTKLKQFQVLDHLESLFGYNLSEAGVWSYFAPVLQKLQLPALWLATGSELTGVSQSSNRTEKCEQITVRRRDLWQYRWWKVTRRGGCVYSCPNYCLTIPSHSALL